MNEKQEGDAIERESLKKIPTVNPPAYKKVNSRNRFRPEIIGANELQPSVEYADRTIDHDSVQ